jgi:hypothetical protein
VNIRSDRLRCVERAGAHEQAVAGYNVIAAPQGGSARLAKEHIVMMLAAASRQPERLRSRGARFDKLCLDPDVDDERTAGQTLTVPAVTA